MLNVICTGCKTTFSPDRYRVRVPKTTDAVVVLDTGAFALRLGAKYWATRRFAHSVLLQHYHHTTFAAASEIYHEGLDEEQLSHADRQHFFRWVAFRRLRS